MRRPRCVGSSVTPACPNAGTTTCSIGALAVGRTAGDFFVRRVFVATNRSGDGGVLGLTDTYHIGMLRLQEDLLFADGFD